MTEFEKTKELISMQLRRTAVVARLGIESNEWTQAEAEEFIKECGNEHFNNILTMGKGEFMITAMEDALRAAAKIMEGGR